MEPIARRLAPHCLATIVLLWAVGLDSSPTLSARESDSDSPGSTPTSSAPPPYGSKRIDAPPLPDALYFEFGMEELYRRANLSVEEVFAHVGLHVPENCLDFSDRTRLERRRRRWRHALRLLRSTHPERVYGWLIGRRSPPDLALAEARHQRNCLIDGMFEGAAEPDQFSAEIGGRRLQSRDRFQRWKTWYRERPRRRRQLRRAVTKSHLRSATAQASIWYRKFVLDDSHFNRVTAEAARKCGLGAGQSWKPALERHRRCWFEILDGPARERQILTASSAPGTSRHHWGTEFDFFDLNPYRFLEGRVYAEEYAWLRAHALDFGFFQTYRRDKPDPERPGYIAEPWHWSYYPIGRALTEFAAEHEDEMERRLNRLWDRLARRFNAVDGTDYAFFQYVRRHWRAFVFNISGPRPHSTSDSAASEE
jgi:hypothetical protein